MKYRTIYISRGDEISLYYNNMRLKRDEEIIQIPIEDINSLIIDDVTLQFSVSLFNKLVENDVLVLLCNEKHLPDSQLFPLHNHSRQTKMILNQINWLDFKKQSAWTKIVQSKIHNQKENAVFQNCSQTDINFLNNFENTVELGDKTNREGLAAKKYFTSIFGNSFTREQDTLINASLNYGYAILMSAVARTLSSKGLILPLGIHHKSEYNHYALACDLMEPFRPIIDYFIIKLLKQYSEFDKYLKSEICNILSEKIIITNKVFSISKSIEIYIDAFLKYMTDDKFDFNDNYFPQFIKGDNDEFEV